MPCQRHARCVRRDKNGVVHCPLDHSDKNPSNESRREIFHQAELLGIFEIPRERVSTLLEMSIDMSALLGPKLNSELMPCLRLARRARSALLLTVGSSHRLIKIAFPILPPCLIVVGWSVGAVPPRVEEIR